MFFVELWLAVMCPPLTVTSTPFSVKAVGLLMSMFTSVVKLLFSSASSSSGRYSLAVVVGSAEVWSILTEKVVSSPVVVELLPEPGVVVDPLSSQL